jgi:hypothetical protein
MTASRLRALLQDCVSGLVISAMAIAIAGCAGGLLPSTNESLDWDLAERVLVYEEKTGWRGVRGDHTSRRIYAMPGVTSQNWTEKVEVTVLPIAITLGTKVRWNPESVMDSVKADLEKEQCSTEMWTVLHKDESSILWEWRDINCPGRLTEHEIVRVVMGKWYLWMISHEFRNRAVSSEENARLIEHLMSAKVVHQ